MSDKLPPVSFVTNMIKSAWEDAKEVQITGYDHRGVNELKVVEHPEFAQRSVNWYRGYAELYGADKLDKYIKAYAELPHLEGDRLPMIFDEFKAAVGNYIKYPKIEVELPGVRNVASKLSVASNILLAPIKVMADYKEAAQLVRPLVDNGTLNPEAGRDYADTVVKVKLMQTASMNLDPTMGYPLFKEWADKHHVSHQLQDKLDPTGVSKATSYLAPEA